jgi:molybdopterin biosynthesis enzyme
MQEQVEPAGVDRIRLLRQPRAGENVLPQGAEMRRGELILSAGTVIRPAEIGVLASVGKNSRARVPPASSCDFAHRRRTGRAWNDAWSRSDTEL